MTTFALASLWTGMLLAAVLLAAIARGLLFGYPKQTHTCVVLTGKEQAIVAACADAIFPPDGPIPLSGTQAGLVEYMDSSLQRIPKEARFLLRLLFVFVEHGPWIFGPRFSRFTKLCAADRVVALRGMAESRIYFRRVAFISLRTMMAMGYLANDVVAARVGMVFRTSPFDVAAGAAA